jgi:hypothetical protein
MQQNENPNTQNSYNQQQYSDPYRQPDESSLAEAKKKMKDLKDIEDLNKPEKNSPLPEGVTPDKGNSAIMKLGMMAILIAAATIAIPALVPFLAIGATVFGLMGLKDVAELATGNKIGAPTKKQKTKNAIEDAKLETVKGATAQVTKDSNSTQPKSQDRSLDKRIDGIESQLSDIANQLKISGRDSQRAELVGQRSVSSRAPSVGSVRDLDGTKKGAGIGTTGH